MEESIPILFLIGRKEVQEFMQVHANEDAKKLGLKYGGKLEFDCAAVSQQIELRQKALKKIPSFIHPLTVMLPKLYEQSTHEAVARYKATFIKGISYLDATTGLGIDTYYIGRNFSRVVCLESNPIHASILEHNYKQLNFIAEIHDLSIEAFLKSNTETFDVVYIDPDRRPGGDRKSFEIDQYTPNVLELKYELQLIANEVWIKLSPMVDIQSVIRNFSPYIRNIVAIAYQNEMKELLLCLKPGEHEIKYTATNLLSDSIQSFTSEEINVKPLLSLPLAYFFEPNIALIKSRLCMEYAKFHKLGILYPHGYFFTTNTIIEGLQGRLFEIIEVLTYKKELMKAFIKNNSIKKANISCRNFFWKPEDVKEQLKLSDGGEWYLFCYNSGDKKPIAIWAKKVNHK